jgi:PAS domain S-box-containing protein
MAFPRDEARRLRTVVLRNAQSILRARRRAEDDLRQQSEWLRGTLASIGDAVISIDVDGRVNFMNDVAQSLTLWTHALALGHPLLDVFRILNEQTRQETRNPALQALRDGTLVGLATHILIAKNGTERPIDDSAAPIRSADGRILGAVLIFRDVARRHRAERALRDSEERLRLATSAAHLGIWVWHFAEDRLIWDEQGTHEIFKLPPAAMPGQLERLRTDFLHADDRPALDAALAAVFDTQADLHFVGRFHRADGALRWIELTGRLQPTTTGDQDTIVGTVADVTERKKAEVDREALLESERAARADAERASLVKEEFLAMLSHELRTPLNAIVGWTQVLRREPPTSQTLAQGLSVIDRNARMQTQLIADLLDMSLIMSGKMRIDPERVELRVVIEAALESVRASAEAKGITIQSVLSPIAATVNGDPMRLQQVVWNLLTNAIKFTPEGGHVRVLLGQVDSDVEISVRDTGKGIQPEFLPHVFERFRQAETSTAREHRGLGLGLAIVKQLVDVHGGRVDVTSDGEGTGSTFTVHLPVASPEMTNDGLSRHSSALQFMSAQYEAPDLGGVTVLAVDDDPDARDLIGRLLRDCGARVLLAGSTNEALSTMERERLDVIVSDIAMPVRDGYSFMSAVRRMGIRTPAVALSAFARTEDRRRSLHAGFQTHVSKPVEPAELVAIVAALAHKAVGSTQARSS